MYRLLRAVSIILFLSLLLGVAATILLEREEGRANSSRLFAFTLVAVLFTLPLAGLYLWLFYRSSLVDTISDRARRLAGGDYATPLPRSPAFAGELLRALEELRQTFLRQKELHHRNVAVMAEILDGMGEGLLAIDRHKKVVLANRRFAELSGVTVTIGKPFLEVFRNAALLEAFDQALEGKPSQARTAVLVGGEDRQLEMRIFPLATSAEIAAVALLIDISPLVRLENMRRNLIADFSHEVRTPLAGLRAAVETLETRRVEPEQEQQLKKIIGRQLSRLERLVDDVKQLNEIESGHVVLDKKKVELKQLLRDLCDDFSEQLDGSQTQLRVDGDASEAYADPTRVQQIFANLIDNALKHAGGATEVRIEVEDREKEAAVRVCDDGQGIPVEEQERIFRRFYRSDPSRSQKVAGTGLGLAITKHLVLLHGGSITVNSKPGQGAVFEVRLPKS